MLSFFLRWVCKESMHQREEHTGNTPICVGASLVPQKGGGSERDCPIPLDYLYNLKGRQNVREKKGLSTPTPVPGNYGFPPSEYDGKLQPFLGQCACILPAENDVPSEMRWMKDVRFAECPESVHTSSGVYAAYNEIPSVRLCFAMIAIWEITYSDSRLIARSRKSCQQGA